MNSQNNTIESHGKDVDEAIAKGLEALGLSLADVEVTVLNEGSSGFLGLGTREAAVRLDVKTQAKVGEEGVRVEPPVTEPADEVIIEPAPMLQREDELSRVEEIGPGEEELAQEIVDRLLSKMDIQATTDLRRTEPDDLTGDRRWVIDIQGDDLGLLIGSRGETLNAFQYVVRLMTGHLIQRRPSFIIDVEGYRERREQALARLAQRMAGKAIQRQKPITLEPMPPNERRIIHIALRKNSKVYTESSGEGQKRRVRIYPKQESK